MTSALIGQITLSISFVFYLALLAPQLIHNWKYRSTQTLSLGMHYLMCSAYILDLLYSFGRHMQWQYKVVTIVGILSLAIQHWQIYQYSELNPQQRRHYRILTGLLCASIGVIIGILITESSWSPKIFVWAGGGAQIASLIYVIPQIIKNYTLRSTRGVSLYFVFMMIFLGGCDTVSAWALGWDWPSQYGAPLGIALKLILLYQFFVFSKVSRSVIKLR
ncbi:MAG: PQ-loop repeat-containing protein [Gammaproteobacteria bacterium]